MNIAKTASRYRAPTAYASAEVSLDEFSIEQIETHLAHLRGSDRTPGDVEGGFEFTGDEMNRINTLVLCGQGDVALDYVRREISRHIGRKL
ncbi:MAG: hypothetical protein WC023_06445 [Rhodocyclaceae bacterium]